MHKSGEHDWLSQQLQSHHEEHTPRKLHAALQRIFVLQGPHSSANRFVGNLQHRSAQSRRRLDWPKAEHPQVTRVVTTKLAVVRLGAVFNDRYLPLMSPIDQLANRLPTSKQMCDKYRPR